jgi:hypothetical protein
MEVEFDYETDLILAVFATREGADGAVRRLSDLGVNVNRAQATALPPGQYDVADGALGESFAGLVRGAEIGLPVGAAIGLGAAASLLGGPSVDVLAGMAVGGAFVGGVLGALEGAVIRARFDDNIAVSHAVPEGSPEVLLALHTPGSDGTTSRARRILTAAGAVAFLDASTVSG